MNIRGEHLSVDSEKLHKYEKKSDRLGYNNFFSTKNYNMYNGRENQKDVFTIEHSDQSTYLSTTMPRGYRNINFRKYSNRPSIVTKQQNIHEKRFDSFNLKP